MPNDRKFPWGRKLITDNYPFEKVKHFNNLGNDFRTC